MLINPRPLRVKASSSSKPLPSSDKFDAIVCAVQIDVKSLYSAIIDGVVQGSAVRSLLLLHPLEHEP
jgi:hypothetical protein